MTPTLRNDRHGASTLGCLVTLAILAGAVYLGLLVGRPFFRYKQFDTAIKNSARYASALPDSVIVARLASLADSLGLPGSARTITITRTKDSILIRSSYTETVTLPVIGEKSFEFTPTGRDAR